MKKLGGLVPLLTALTLLTGCGREAYLVDDADCDDSIADAVAAIGDEIAAATPPNPFGDDGYSPEEDQLHQPYVIGATIGFKIYDEDEQAKDPVLASANPAILRVESQSLGRVTCKAVGPGVATMWAVDDDGDVIGEWHLEVAEPDRIELLPYALERGGNAQDFAAGASMRA